MVLPRWKFEPIRYGDCPRPRTQRQGRLQDDALKFPRMNSLMEETDVVGRAKRTPHDADRDQNILAALSSVLYTPQASGIPTKAQNSAALASRPPLSMPNEPL